MRSDPFCRWKLEADDGEVTKLIETAAKRQIVLYMRYLVSGASSHCVTEGIDILGPQFAQSPCRAMSLRDNLNRKFAKTLKTKRQKFIANAEISVLCTKI